MYVRGVESGVCGFIQSNLTHVGGCNAMYVEGVEKSLKWSYTSLLITFLIFNGFSIRKKFWEAET